MTISQRILIPFHYGSSPQDPLSTSLQRHQPPSKILACSAIDQNQQRLFELQGIGRKLCEDRKTFFEHLTPNSLFRSTLRLVVTQSSIVLSQYANDQLQQDLARDELVENGKISQEAADEEAEEWERREWKLRWESFPSKLTDALVKFHAITLVMRLYENIAEKFVDKYTLDALTLDTHRCAKRIAAKEDSKIEVGKQMFPICGRANIIGIFADYSVHQIILCFGYYAYIRDQRKRRQQRKKDVESGNGDKEDEKPPILRQSVTLVVSRGLSLLFIAAGGAVGSMIMPGWGTTVGCNGGDNLGGVFLDVYS